MFHAIDQTKVSTIVLHSILDACITNARSMLTVTACWERACVEQKLFLERAHTKWQLQYCKVYSEADSSLSFTDPNKMICVGTQHNDQWQRVTNENEMNYSLLSSFAPLLLWHPQYRHSPTAKCNHPRHVCVHRSSCNHRMM
jgi:hypothetical protein